MFFVTVSCDITKTIFVALWNDILVALVGGLPVCFVGSPPYLRVGTAHPWSSGAAPDPVHCLLFDIWSPVNRGMPFTWELGCLVDRYMLLLNVIWWDHEVSHDVPSYIIL